jgi:hypothetical protein
VTIEIRQLIVRAVVERGRAEQPRAAAPTPPTEPLRRNAAEAHRAASPDPVEACVREVLRRLERARER